MMVWGQAPDPFGCWLLERGLKTLDVRVQRQNETAQCSIAEWARRAKTSRLCIIRDSPSHPDHAVACEQQLDGFGGMLAIELAGGGKAADRFIRRLTIWTHAPSLGGTDSLVCEPRYNSHASLVE